MKLLMLALCVSALIALTAAAPGADSAARKSTGKLRHVVAFKFKESATAGQIDQAVEAFRALKKKIPSIKGFEWGTNVSPEKRDKGFTHQFILTFRSEKDRDGYLVHPAHQEFGKLVGPLLADVFVIDFRARD